MVYCESCEDLLDAIDEHYPIYGEEVGRWCDTTPYYPEDEDINPPEWIEPVMCCDDEPLDPMEDLIEYLEDK